MDEQQFYHMLIRPSVIKIVEAKDAFVFIKDSKSSVNKLNILVNLRTIASHGAITFMYLKIIKCVASPTPHCSMMFLVIMAVGHHLCFIGYYQEHQKDYFRDFVQFSLKKDMHSVATGRTQFDPLT